MIYVKAEWCHPRLSEKSKEGKTTFVLSNVGLELKKNPTTKEVIISLLLLFIFLNFVILI